MDSKLPGFIGHTKFEFLRALKPVKIPLSLRVAPPANNYSCTLSMRWVLNKFARHGLMVNLIALSRTEADSKTYPDAKKV